MVAYVTGTDIKSKCLLLDVVQTVVASIRLREHQQNFLGQKRGKGV